MSVKRALISVSDKAGIADFARGLVELGVEIISTGGTAKALQKAGVPVTSVSDVTGFPEILAGRVKTLHPSIHGGILARRTPDHLNQIQEHNIEPIDLVAVNLYPFEETVANPGVTLEQAIENIDIGGPTLVRAAAKNHQDVIIVVSPHRYPEILDTLKAGKVDTQFRQELALEAFSHTASYDAAISNYLSGIVQPDSAFPATFHLNAQRRQLLRYGENPHQQAAFYQDNSIQGPCIANAKQLHGKELSYNNILDLNSALELVKEFTEPACVIIKHNNPCGTACAQDNVQAYNLAYETDPVSAFGGIVAFNNPVDRASAEEMTKIFLEAVIAPAFEPDALEVLKNKENLRLLETGVLDASSNDFLDVRKVNGGFLLQDADREVIDPKKLRAVTEKRPSDQLMQDILFAMTVAKHVKSNAIVVVKDRQVLGVGAGQMNRVGSARIALGQAGEKAHGAILASDAFFPFRDTVDQAARAGIKVIVQPGGSMRDEESIKAANEHGIIMVFTGMRHFKH